MKKIVLIDDDDLIHLAWGTRAQEAGVDLHSFKSVSDFLDKADNFVPGHTQIYIDKNLGAAVTGDLAAKSIWDIGFRHIILATGDSLDDQIRHPWLFAIQGKKPPF